MTCEDHVKFIAMAFLTNDRMGT